VLSACAGAQNPVSALNSNASSLPPLQCNHFVTFTLLYSFCNTSIISSFVVGTVSNLLISFFIYCQIFLIGLRASDNSSQLKLQIL
jgi:hypothetical protein